MKGFIPNPLKPWNLKGMVPITLSLYLKTAQPGVRFSLVHGIWSVVPAVGSHVEIWLRHKALAESYVGSSICCGGPFGFGFLRTICDPEWQSFGLLDYLLDL